MTRKYRSSQVAVAAEEVIRRERETERVFKLRTMYSYGLKKGGFFVKMIKI